MAAPAQLCNCQEYSVPQKATCYVSLGFEAEERRNYSVIAYRCHCLRDKKKRHYYYYVPDNVSLNAQDPSVHSFSWRPDSFSWRQDSTKGFTSRRGTTVSTPTRALDVLPSDGAPPGPTDACCFKRSPPDPSESSSPSDSSESSRADDRVDAIKDSHVTLLERLQAWDLKDAFLTKYNAVRATAGNKRQRTGPSRMAVALSSAVFLLVVVLCVVSMVLVPSNPEPPTFKQESHGSFVARPSCSVDSTVARVPQTAETKETFSSLNKEVKNTAKARHVSVVISPSGHLSTPQTRLVDDYAAQNDTIMILRVRKGREDTRHAGSLLRNLVAAFSDKFKKYCDIIKEKQTFARVEENLRYIEEQHQPENWQLIQFAELFIVNPLKESWGLSSDIQDDYVFVDGLHLVDDSFLQLAMSSVWNQLPKPIKIIYLSQPDERVMKASWGQVGVSVTNLDTKTRENQADFLASIRAQLHPRFQNRTDALALLAELYFPNYYLAHLVVEVIKDRPNMDIMQTIQSFPKLKETAPIIVKWLEQKLAGNASAGFQCEKQATACQVFEVLLACREPPTLQELAFVLDLQLSTLRDTLETFEALLDPVDLQDPHAPVWLFSSIIGHFLANATQAEARQFYLDPKEGEAILVQHLLESNQFISTGYAAKWGCSHLLRAGKCREAALRFLLPVPVVATRLHVNNVPYSMILQDYGLFLKTAAARDQMSKAELDALAEMSHILKQHSHTVLSAFCGLAGAIAGFGSDNLEEHSKDAADRCGRVQEHVRFQDAPSSVALYASLSNNVLQIAGKVLASVGETGTVELWDLEYNILRCDLA